MKQKLCAPFSDSQSKEFIWRTRRNARAFNAEHHGEWEKMMHGLLQRPSPSTRTWWARIEGPLSDWEIGICASVSRYTRPHLSSGIALAIELNPKTGIKMAGWTGLEPVRKVVFPSRSLLRHQFSGSSVALFSPFSIGLSHGTWTLAKPALA
jgi:hypothetical protein